MKKDSKIRTLPALAFNSPYWELVFQGKLNLGEYAVKTRKDDRYSHRGLVLCYTGLKTADGPLRAHGFVDEAVRRLKTVKDVVPNGVVGCALVVDVRQLSPVEKVSLFKGYNNRPYESIADTSYPDAHPDDIYAMDCGYFMKPVFRFKYPFVTPVQHMFGPIGRIPLYRGIETQLPKWAKEEFAKAA